MSLMKFLAKGGEDMAPLLAKLKGYGRTAGEMGMDAARSHPGLAGGALGAAGGVAADEALSEDDDPIKKLLKKLGLG